MKNFVLACAIASIPMPSIASLPDPPLTVLYGCHPKSDAIAIDVDEYSSAKRRLSEMTPIDWLQLEKASGSASAIEKICHIRKATYRVVFSIDSKNRCGAFRQVPTVQIFRNGVSVRPLFKLAPCADEKWRLDPSYVVSMRLWNELGPWDYHVDLTHAATSGLGPTPNLSLEPTRVGKPPLAAQLQR